MDATVTADDAAQCEEYERDQPDRRGHAKVKGPDRSRGVGEKAPARALPPRCAHTIRVTANTGDTNEDERESRQCDSQSRELNSRYSFSHDEQPLPSP